MEDKPFIFTSGWASPVYTDCRRLISFPRVPDADRPVSRPFRDAGFEQFDTVVGGETAGIPFAAWMADRLMLPMQYVRRSRRVLADMDRSRVICSRGGAAWSRI
jgi:orotate phosphoribosyltransferase